MRQGKKNFPNGLTIVYAYPDDRSPNISSLVQLHFGFKDRYGQRSDATFSDAFTAIDRIKQDIHELKIWIKENGMLRYFSGGTSTQLLIIILISLLHFFNDKYILSVYFYVVMVYNIGLSILFEKTY